MASSKRKNPSTYSGRLPVQFIERFPFPACCKKSNIEFAIYHKLESTDIILSWYPFSISSWILNCLWKLINLTSVNPNTNKLENCLIPSIEHTGPRFLDRCTRPTVMRYNLPYWLIPKNRDAKYIYICRNPKDVLLSCYSGVLRQSSQPITFGDFFGDFFTGDLPYGDYFEHVLSWYRERKEKNVLFLFYENMHINPAKTILDIAIFLGPSYRDWCLENHAIDNILSFPNFDYKHFTIETDFPHQAFPELLRKHREFKKAREESVDKGCSASLRETGYIGFGKHFLTREQSEIIDYKIVTEFKETDLINMRNF